MRLIVRAWGVSTSLIAVSLLRDSVWRNTRAFLCLSMLVASPITVAGVVHTQEIDPVCKPVSESASGLLSEETSSDQAEGHRVVDRVPVKEPAAPIRIDPESEQLSVIALPRGWTLNQAVSMPDWLTLSASALSQNNGSVAGVESSQFTSSNLFNLGFRLTPLAALKSGVAVGTTAPRQGSDVGDSLHYKIAINGLFTQRVGQILSSSIPNELNTQWNFGNGPVARLGFLNLEYKSDGDFISMLKIGKLMQAQDFTMNPIQCYFSNFGFCGWAQGVPAMIDIPGNPFNSYGAVVAFGNSPSINFRYGVYQIAPATFPPNLHGIDFSFNKGIGVAQFAEIRLPILTNTRVPINYNKQSNKAVVSAQQQANAVYESLLPQGILTLGRWLGSGSFPEVVDSDLSGNKNNGVYGIISLRIPGLPLGLDHRVFISSGMGLTPNVQQFNAGGNAGLVIEGLVPGRLFDTFSIGTSFASYNTDYFLPGLTSSSFEPGTEWVVELNYSININQNVRVMPNIQIIFNPGGNSNRSTAAVAGLQLWYFF